MGLPIPRRIGVREQYTRVRLQLYYQMNQLEEDYRDQRISRRDYEIRKGQVEIGVILY